MLSRYYAVKELLESDVNSLPITTEHLEAIIKNKGFKIINYSTSDNRHAELLNELGVLSLASRTKAFTYSDNKEKIIFVKIGISANEKRLLLAHELGHIALGHISGNSVAGYKPSGLIDEGQEDESNSFALELLAPVCVLKQRHINTPQKISAVTLLDEKRSRLVADEVCNHREFADFEIELCERYKTSAKKIIGKKVNWLLVVLGLCIFVILGALCLNLKFIKPEAVQDPSPQLQNAAPEVSDIVCITKSGKKYHKADCMYVRDKENTIEITIDEAINNGYEPCKICKP